MKVHDSHVPADQFGAFIEQFPQACVELVVTTKEGILLTRRTNPPAQGEWFWPGSRLYKGEQLSAAARRVGREELGLEVSLLEQLGVQEHFWETTNVQGATSRHTVNVVYLAEPVDSTAEIVLDDQHDAYRYVTRSSPDLHEYVSEYIEEYGLGEPREDR